MASSGGGDGGGNDNSQFLTSGSSALILAFLAIGLFVGGLLVMFAMRRYVVLSRRRAGTWEPAANAGPWNWDDTAFGVAPALAIALGPVRRQKDIGARPVLFDVHVEKAASDDWEAIMPISAKAEYGDGAQPHEDAPPHDTHSETTSNSASTRYLHPFAIGMHDFVSAIRPSRRRARSRPPSPSPHPPPLFHPSVPGPADAGRTSARSDATPALASAPVHPSQLRVALTIAMPTQQECKEGVPPCVLGIADVRWSGGSLEELRRAAAGDSSRGD
ncbi:hypothetical protein BV20DRAFT_975398 [Pilatotrama ljubarskyi]|nr:hypothetical protein BV20DRAFT_975398 [Pilatotrama ljubarskyi]